MQFDAIKALVRDDFQAVDDLILSSLRSEASIINDLGHYIIHSGGKRLRPIVALLIAKACGYRGKDHIKIAAIIELVHTASLLHDDVVDGSDYRRGKKTANHVFGNEAAVLVGDFIYSKCFQLLLKLRNNLPIMKVFADATLMMAEGEAFQLMDRYNPKVTEGTYLNIIRSKTAKLFEAASELSAILAESPKPIQKAMANYGMHLGTAFQLIDDILDFEAPISQTGKPMGTDLSEGKATLPLIHILETGTASELRLVRSAIKSGGTDTFEEIKRLIERKGSIEYTMQFARVESERAAKALEKLPESPYKEAAKALAQFAIERSH